MTGKSGCGVQGAGGCVSYMSSYCPVLKNPTPDTLNPLFTAAALRDLAIRRETAEGCGAAGAARAIRGGREATRAAPQQDFGPEADRYAVSPQPGLAPGGRPEPSIKELA